LSALKILWDFSIVCLNSPTLGGLGVLGGYFLPVFHQRGGTGFFFVR
jgi:hypothetical protein